MCAASHTIACGFCPPCEVAVHASQAVQTALTKAIEAIDSALEEAGFDTTASISNNEARQMMLNLCIFTPTACAPRKRPAWPYCCQSCVWTVTSRPSMPKQPTHNGRWQAFVAITSFADERHTYRLGASVYHALVPFDRCCMLQSCMRILTLKQTHACSAWPEIVQLSPATQSQVWSSPPCYAIVHSVIAELSSNVTLPAGMR